MGVLPGLWIEWLVERLDYGKQRYAIEVEPSFPAGVVNDALAVFFQDSLTVGMGLERLPLVRHFTGVQESEV